MSTQQWTPAEHEACMSAIRQCVANLRGVLACTDLLRGCHEAQGHCTAHTCYQYCGLLTLMCCCCIGAACNGQL